MYPVDLGSNPVVSMLQRALHLSVSAGRQTQLIIYIKAKILKRISLNFRILKSFYKVFLFKAKLKVRPGSRVVSTGPKPGVTSNLRHAQNMTAKMTVISGKKWIQATGYI